MASQQFLLRCLLALLPLAVTAKERQQTRLRVTNGCEREPLWIAHETVGDAGPDPQNIKLLPNSSHDFEVTTQLTGTRYWAKAMCDKDGAHCAIGESGGPGDGCSKSAGCAPHVDTKFEASFGQNGFDWVDISLTDGFTLPFKLEMQAGKGNCLAADSGMKLPSSTFDCSHLSLDQCPTEEDLGAAGTNVSLQVIHPDFGAVVGCFSPCSRLTLQQFNKDNVTQSSDSKAVPYCCPTPPLSPVKCRGGPVAKTSYVKTIHSACPNVLSFSYDNGVGLMKCPDDTKYEVTFYCPKHFAGPPKRALESVRHAPQIETDATASHHDHDRDRHHGGHADQSSVHHKHASTSTTVQQKHHGKKKLSEKMAPILEKKLKPQSTRLRITNACDKEPIWIAHEAGADIGPDAQNIKIEALSAFDFTVNDGLTGTRYWPKMRCNADGDDCGIGESGGPQQNCNKEKGCAPPVDTKFEGSFGMSGTDWVDISLVDGFTLPFKFEMKGDCGAGFGNKSAVKVIDCSDLSFSSCPTGDDLGNAGKVDLQVRHPHTGDVVGCYSPCSKLTLGQWDNEMAEGKGPWDDQVVPYCCPTPPESPESCRAGPVGSTQFVEGVHRMCPGVYGYSYDDGMGLLQCPSDTKYEVTFYCPPIVQSNHSDSNSSRNPSKGTETATTTVASGKDHGTAHDSPSQSSTASPDSTTSSESDNDSGTTTDVEDVEDAEDVDVGKPWKTRLRVTNACPDEPMWIAHEAGASVGTDPQNVKIEPLDSYDFQTADADGNGLTGTRYWPKMRCNKDGDDCGIGESGGPGQTCNKEEGCGPPVDTKFEGSFEQSGGIDWVDISLVDGFTLPFKFVMHGGKDCVAGLGDRLTSQVIDCSHLSIGQCPLDEDLGDAGKDVNLQVKHPVTGEAVGCYSPCSYLTLSQWKNKAAEGKGPWDAEVVPYCCPTPPESPEACRAGPVGSTSFVKKVHKMCPGVYGFSYDDGMGLVQCPDTTKYEVTFYCPRNGTEPHHTSSTATTTAHKHNASSPHSTTSKSGATSTTRKSTTTRTAPERATTTTKQRTTLPPAKNSSNGTTGGGGGERARENLVWQVVGDEEVHVHASMHAASKVLAKKPAGSAFHGERLGAWIKLTDENGFVQAKAHRRVQVKQASITVWLVMAQHGAPVHATKHEGGKHTHTKIEGATVRGVREGDWIALVDEPGFIFMPTGSGDSDAVEEVSSVQWRVQWPGGVRIRQKRSATAKMLGSKSHGTIFRGWEEGNWVELADEPGFMMITSRGHVLLEKAGQADDEVHGLEGNTARTASRPEEPDHSSIKIIMRKYGAGHVSTGSRVPPAHALLGACICLATVVALLSLAWSRSRRTVALAGEHGWRHLPRNPATWSP